MPTWNPFTSRAGLSAEEPESEEEHHGPPNAGSKLSRGYSQRAR